MTVKLDEDGIPEPIRDTGAENCPWGCGAILRGAGRMDVPDSPEADDAAWAEVLEGKRPIYCGKCRRKVRVVPDGIIAWKD
jgi:hypothetical protein